MQDKYYEDYEIGQQFTSPARTITEADIVAYAGISGDYSQLHINKEHAKNTPFGQRVAHGLLGLTVAQGMETWTDISFANGIASLGWTWDFRKPIFIGDSLHLQVTVAKKRMTKNPGRGIVYVSGKLFNQKDEVVQEGEHRVMVKVRNITQADESRRGNR